MFDNYQSQASRTFKEHTPLTAEQSELADWVMGLPGEAGEVSELVKHHLFHGETLDKMKLAKELGDVMWYVSAIAKTCDIQMSAIAELNIAKLNHRHHGGSYSHEHSQDRAHQEVEFSDTPMYKAMEARILKKEAPINIIIVGPDGSGKTTLAGRLLEALEAQDVSYCKCNFVGEDKPTMALDMLGAHSNRIYDRFYYPDDIIYSGLKWARENPAVAMDWDTDYWRKYNEVRDRLCELNTVVFYVTADMQVLQERSESWADDYISVSDLPSIQDKYQRWLSYLANLPIIQFHIDTTGGDVEEYVYHMVTCVKRAQALFSGLEVNTFLDEEQLAYVKKLDASKTPEEIAEENAEGSDA